MSNKLTLTIGIPAYNESLNLKRLISELHNQKRTNFNLKEIIISLDGCTDNSFSQLTSLQNPNLKIINNLHRLGKPARLNQIFSKTNSDLIVTLDADITLASFDTLTQLVSPFIKNPKVKYVSGTSAPHRPVNYVQKAAYAGIRIWNFIRLKNANPMYYTEGAVRAFSRDFYSHLKFPDTSADDIYPYIYAKTNNFLCAYNPKAKINYRLPTSLKDYLNQQYRYLQAPKIQRENFNQEIVDTFFDVNISERTKGMLYGLKVDPVFSTLYFIFWLITKIRIFATKPYYTSQWKILATTK